MTTTQGTYPSYTERLESHLSPLGWTPNFQRRFDRINTPNRIPARVIGVRKNKFWISSDGEKEWWSTAVGRLGHASNELYPVTGD